MKSGRTHNKSMKFDRSDMQGVDERCSPRPVTHFPNSPDPNPIEHGICQTNKSDQQRPHPETHRTQRMCQCPGARHHITPLETPHPEGIEPRWFKSLCF